MMRERGRVGDDEKKKKKSDLTFPGNLSQISIVISKIQIKAIHQRFCLKPNRQLNLGVSGGCAK